MKTKYGREVGHLEINSYSYNGKDIVINRIGVYDTKGNYIKWAKLKEVEKYLSEYPVLFKTKL